MVNDKSTVAPLQILLPDRLTAVAANVVVTVTIWVDVLVLPAASVAVHTTVVAPRGNLILVVDALPLDGVATDALQVAVGVEQLSPTPVGVPKLEIMAEQFVVLTGAVMAAGAVMVGSVLSSIV